ncbi:MAG: acetoacetate--CoA ligase [Deltaproteobacteria bacterium]|nr:acetoacetate--CoA ligase [Deltaproteobacteria bacterium]
MADRSQLSYFIRHFEAGTGRSFASSVASLGKSEHGDDFHAFSAREFRLFWQLFLDFSGLIHEGAAEPVCEGDDCETAHFFPELRLNYPENLLSGFLERPAVIARTGDGQRDELSRGELRQRVLRLACALDRLGVRPGDRVACIGRNNTGAIVAALAAATVGAVFSSCGPDMGVFAMVSRFAPLAPVVLFANTRPEQWDVGAPLAERVAETAAGLLSLRAIIGLDDGPLAAGVETHRLAELTATTEAFLWERRNFNHPLFAMFSSGTTGAPKCILHGTGGTLLEHVKEHRLHCDLRPGERLFFQTSCGWMMWNWQLSALASCVELVLYDGPLLAPETLWRIVAEERVSVFGTSPAYLRFCEDANFSPRRQLDLDALRSVLSTGSILFPRQYDWVAAHVGGIPLQSISGGTDIIGCFVLGHPDLPVHRGEAQCRSLGLDVRAVPPADEPGSKVGELVCANPFPSRPIGLWNDPDGSRFHAAYFAQNPGMWTHGDLIEFTHNGGARLHGRSDGVLNVRGVRVGPAEIYSILQKIPEITGAMAVEQATEDEPGGSRLILLVTLPPGAKLDATLAAHIRATLLADGSAAMVPSRIAAVSALPETHNGKRSEAAARAAVNRQPVRNRAALRNPECLDEIISHPALRAPLSANASPDRLPLDGRLEDELRALSERILEVSPIGRKDNLFTIRGDSLANLNLLMEIERRSGRRLPFEDLFASPSIDGLAALLREERTEQVSGIAVRRAAASDVEEICALLNRAASDSGSKPLGEGARHRLFGYQWLNDKPDLGFVLVDEKEIVGFLGTIYAQRQIKGKKGMVCNFWFWYVRPMYRGWGTTLLSSALRDDVTYTSLTPTMLSQRAFKTLGFQPLGSTMVVMLPCLHAETLRHPQPRIVLDPRSVRPMLTEQQQRVFDDHAPYCLQLIAREDHEQAYIVVKRRTAGVPVISWLLPSAVRIPYSDVLHCSNPRLLARHLERVKLAVMRHQKTVLLVADAELFPERPRGLTRTAPALYRSSLFRPDELDKLYSEFVLPTS